MRKRRHLEAAGAIVVWLAAGAAAAQAPGEPVALGLTTAAPLMRWDPQVRYGRLPNGLRYALEHTSTPKGAVSLRLGFTVGSYQEDEAERGAAHLVEHMAFEATRSFGESQAALTFAPVKMVFGADRNAASDLAQTTYQIDLPTLDPLQLTAAEKWLRDVADGLVFGEPAVTRQRSVVEAERAARTGGLAQFRERVSAFEDGGLRSAARPILGPPQTGATLTPARLKAFYDRWYRPENAVLVIAGDLPLDAMEQQVRAVFGDWSGRGAAGAAPPSSRVPVSLGVEVMTETVPGATPVVRICRVAAPDNVQDAPAARLRILLLREVWRAVLQRRLNVVGTRSDAPFTQTNISTDLRPDSLKTCVAMAPSKGGELRAIGLVQGEVEKFAVEGPTDAEIEIALGQLRALIRGAIGGTPGASNQAGEILQRALDGMPQLAPREGLRAFDVLLEDLQPPAVKGQFARDWAGRGPLVTVGGPEAISADAIRKAMTVTAPASRPASEEIVVYADMGGRRTADQQAQLERAEQALRAGKPKDARRDFEDLLRRNPQDLQVLAGRGRAFAAEGKIDPALKDFASALAISPDDPVALNARGSLYVAINQAERAIPDFDRALVVNPKDDVVLYNRGLAFKQMGRHDRAIRDFDAVLRLTPRDPLTLTGKADAYRQLGDLLLAREFYDAALAAQPLNATALQGRGEVREALGDAAGGAADKARARQIDPSIGGS
ncbi:MAG: tetratricopeptide repeat protein [Phenylobacterium sp.]